MKKKELVTVNVENAAAIDRTIAENVNSENVWRRRVTAGVNPFERSHFSTALYSDVIGTPSEKLFNKKGELRVRISAPEFRRGVINVREKIENGDYNGIVTLKMLYELKAAEAFIEFMNATPETSDPDWKSDGYNAIADVVADERAFQERARNAIRHIHKKHQIAVDRVLKTSADYDETIIEMFCKYSENPDAYNDEKGVSFNMNTLAMDALTALMKERGIHRGSFGKDDDGKRLRAYIADGDISLNQTVSNDDGDAVEMAMFMQAKNNTEMEAIAHVMRAERRAENKAMIGEMTRIGRVICSEFMKEYRRMEINVMDAGARRLAVETVLSSVCKSLGLSRKKYISERNKLFALFVKYGKRPDHRVSKIYANGVCNTVW